MLNFAIDGAAAVATPATVRAQVVEATAQEQKAVGLVALVNGKLQPPAILPPIHHQACLGNGRGLILPQQGARVLW